MKIGQGIKILRQNKFPKQKQYQFAEHVGITQTYLSQIEGGKKEASTEVLNSIAEYCGVPLAVLFWFSIEEEDIAKNKKQAFRIVKPSVDAMIETFI